MKVFYAAIITILISTVFPISVYADDVLDTPDVIVTEEGEAEMYSGDEADCDKNDDENESNDQTDPDITGTETGFEYTTETEGYTITLSAEEGVLPADTRVDISVIDDNTDTGISDIVKKEIGEGSRIVRLIAFDISLYCNDEKIQPEDGTVKVSIVLDENMSKGPGEPEEASVDVFVYHIDSEEMAESIASEVTDENEVVFEADEFSPYVVAFTTTSVTDDPETNVEYTVVFDGNGATSGEMMHILCERGTELGLPVNAFARRGYAFGGWNTEADGNGDTYEDEAVVKDLAGTDVDSITLYAQWIPNHYSVKFYGNGSTSGNMEEMSGCECDKEYNLSANSFKNKGYRFAGWNTKADGSGKSYANKDSFINLSYKDGATVKLYAQWEIVEYQISYDLNGGRNDASNPMSYFIYTDTITLRDPVRKGFTFGGWFADDEFTKPVVRIKQGSAGNKTLYAKWTANRYTIRFNGNDSTGGTMGDMKGCKYSVQYTITPNAFKRRGFRFTGWNTRADGTGKTFTDRTQVSNLSAKNNAIVNLYAQWNKVKYTLSYEIRGGNNNSANPTSYTVTSSFTLKEPTRKCYTFSGWFSDNEYKKPINQIKKGTVGNKTLYGKWLINKYKVRFNGNGSTSGSMSDMTCKCNQSYDLTANSYKRTGFIFNGWNTKADGSGTSYKNRASILNLAVKSGKTITLYARWKAINYTVRFSGNGSKAGKMSDVSCRYSKSYKLPVNAYSRPNYRFIGWNTKADGSGKTYADLATVKNLSAKDGAVVTLYALWKKKQTIVWLGDSLTQGSLGDKGDNLDNAPYVRLAGKVDVPVEGYGFYGYKTREIFDAYQYDCGQSIDPGKIYIFWVGSCDWVDDGRANSETGPVIAQIDDFLCKKGRIKNYIVLGTTSRHRLGNKYIPINRDLSDHYGSHYMDVIDIINRYGYSSDRTHLSQASYDAIADAVYNKMKRLGYL